MKRDDETKTKQLKNLKLSIICDTIITNDLCVGQMLGNESNSLLKINRYLYKHI